MQPFVIIGMPRTGSTLLQTTLAQHPDIKMYGELFHAVEAERAGPHAITSKKGNIFFNAGSDDAIDFLRTNVWNKENKKYGAVGFKLFGELVNSAGTSKIFLRLKAEFPDLKFIHIERLNLLECWVSRKAASLTGKWIESDKSSKDKNDIKITANPIELEGFFKNYDEINGFFRSDFFPANNYLNVEYEQLSNEYEKNSLRIFNFLNLPTVQVAPSIKKQRSLTAPQQIENFEEISLYFSKSKYAKMMNNPAVAPITHATPQHTYNYQSLHEQAKKLSIEDWINLVGQSTEQALELNGIPMPSAPPAEKQAVFHGTSGDTAIKSAAPVYRYVLDVCQRNGISQIKSLLDFGCGWGRFTRLFVRDVEEAGLVGVDPWGEALQMCRQHMPYAAFVRSQPSPPLAFRSDLYDVVVANSIFSHLSEPNALAWIKEISRVLRPGGLLIATTHSKDFLNMVKKFQDGSMECKSDWHLSLKNSNLNIIDAINSHNNGEFVHISTGQMDGGYGDSIVPKQFIHKVWGEFLELVEFIDNPARFPQATFVLKKP